MRKNVIPPRGLCLVLLLGACSREASRKTPGASAEAGPATKVSATKPAPFDKGPVKVALVQYSGAGDYFQQWTEGARKQADAIGLSVQTFDAKADHTRQSADMKTAIGSGVPGIIVDHGEASMCPLIQQATKAGIAVVVYDIEITECAPDAVETEQNDADLATLVLTQMAKDVGDGVPVGYVNALGIAPLDRRHEVWKRFVTDHKWAQKFFVGKFTHDVAKDNARLADAALKANPGVKAVFAPYDELTKGTVSAIERNGLETKVAVYGIDISNTDIEIMTKKDSPWKATATTDPSAVGAAVTRTMALELAGKLGRKTVVFPGVLVTQSYLVENGIGSLDDLRARLPALSLADISSADWIESITAAKR